MAFHSLLHKIPEYAKELKQGFEEMLIAKSKYLTDEQIASVTLAASYVLKNEQLINTFQYNSKLYLADSDRRLIKRLIVRVCMKNAYAKYIANSKILNEDFKCVSDLTPELKQMDKVTIHMIELVVSCINQCSICIDFFVSELTEKNISKDAVLELIKIAALLKTTADVLDIETLRTYDFT